MILLRDFLPQAASFGLKEAPRDARDADRTFIFHLRQVCEVPRLGDDAAGLREQIEAFAEWLEEEFVVPEDWLPDIDMQRGLRISRYWYIRLCGDIAQHYPGRLSDVVKHIGKLLRESDRNVDIQTAYLAIENFFNWFFDDIFIYHSSQIAEFLNNIRWEVFNYLQPKFERSYCLAEDATPDFAAYRYNVPESINQPVAHAMCWDIMNRVRWKPRMPRFVIHEMFK